MRYYKYLKRAAQIILIVFLAGLVAVNIYIMGCRVKGKTASVFGKSILKITTGSMDPSIHTGDYILIEKTSPEKLETGDIISFYSADGDIYNNINTHRIIGKNEEGFLTKGDANHDEDAFTVPDDRIIGKYVKKIRYLKWLNSFASLKKLLLLLIILPAFGISVYEVITIAKIKVEIEEDNKENELEEKEKLIREAIEREKEKLRAENFSAQEVKQDESGKNNEEEDVHRNCD